MAQSSINIIKNVKTEKHQYTGKHDNVKHEWTRTDNKRKLEKNN